MNLAATLSPVRARWRALDAREQSLVGAAAVLVGLALLWWVGISPALSTLREAKTQQRALAADLEKMQRLRGQALAIQAQPKMERAESIRALEALVKQRLGASAQLSIIGDRATVTLRNAPAGELAQWLSQARVNARAVPGEARLVRSTAPSANAPAGMATWDGTLVLNLAPQ